MFNILGINERNVVYVKPLNPKKAIKLAKNKLKSKLFLQARGIPVSKVVAVLKDYAELEIFNWNVLTNLKNGFVIKPNKGFGGEGILVVANSTKSKFYKLNGQEISQKELEQHLTAVLDGSFSNLGMGDEVLIEERIINHSFFDGFISLEGGLPDIRVIVYRGVPVMAMLRLPSKDSQGTANLHQGGVGAGIDMVSGKIINLIQKDKIVPTKQWSNLISLSESIPYFDEMLFYSSKIQLATNIGYLAVDFALDRKLWPLVLEVNSRGGLAIQLANMQSLKSRLMKCRDLNILDPKEGVRLAKSLFVQKWKVSKSVVSYVGKQIIGNIVSVTFFLPNQSTHNIKAKIKTTKPLSVIDTQLAIKMGLITKNYDKNYFSVKIKLEEKTQKAIFYLKDLSNCDYKVIIGQNELKGFLIDPFLTKKEAFKDIFSLQVGVVKRNYLKIDNQLDKIDQKIKIIGALNPLNLEEEKEKFFKLKQYNPQFVYDYKFKKELESLKKQLNTIDPGNEWLGVLFLNKKNEIFKKIKLIESIGKEQDFFNASIGLYGKPTKKLIEWSKEILLETLPKKEEVKVLKIEQVKKYFKDYLKEVGLNSVKIKIKENMVSSLAVGKDNVFINKNITITNRKTLKALIAHEIWAHIFTFKNGLLQPFKIFSKWLAGYLWVQEWLAIYNSQLVYPNNRRLIVFAQNVVLINELGQLSFREIFDRYISKGYNEKTAWKMAVKLKRGMKDTAQGGGFTKGYLYLKGLRQIENFLSKGGEYKDLFYGKINIKDLDKIREIKGLKEPKYVFDPKILERVMRK